MLFKQIDKIFNSFAMYAILGFSVKTEMPNIFTELVSYFKIYIGNQQIQKKF